MSEQLNSDSKYRAAFDLAVKIQSAEYSRGTNVAPAPVNQAAAREYWLRLYDQCISVVARTANIEEIVQYSKGKTDLEA